MLRIRDRRVEPLQPRWRLQPIGRDQCSSVLSRGLEHSIDRHQGISLGDGAVNNLLTRTTTITVVNEPLAPGLRNGAGGRHPPLSFWLKI